MSQEVGQEGQEGWEKFKYTEESREGNKDGATAGRRGEAEKWMKTWGSRDKENKYTLIHSFKVFACQEL